MLLALYIGNAPDEKPNHENINLPSIQQVIDVVKRLDGVKRLEIGVSYNKNHLGLHSSPEDRFHVIYISYMNSETRRQPRFVVDLRLSKTTQVKFMLANGQLDSYSAYGTINRAAMLLVVEHFVLTGELVPESQLPEGLAWGNNSYDIY